MNELPIIIAVLTAFSGLWAAWLWHKASRVEIVPLWVHMGTMEPVDGAAQNQWIVALIEAANESARLNRAAASWTALSVFLSASSALVMALM